MLTKQELQSLRNQGNEAEAAADEIANLRAALQWIEDKARARKLEIAPSLLGTGFEFGFWPAGEARVVNAKTLLEAVEAAQRA